MTEAPAWRPDVLGDGWEQLTLPLRPDEQGEAVATLVRRVSRDGDPAPDGAARPAVLYVHGYVDYFFQAHLGDAWDAMGVDFYALDLRGHGRSLLPHQLPNYATELAVHAEELALAVRLLRSGDERVPAHDVVVGHGHSTGGLVLALWAHAHRGGTRPLDALVLNSPWLELNRGWFDCEVTTRVVDVVGRVAPRAVVGQIAPHYGQGLHADTGGAWQYDLTWKPHEGFGVRAGWIRTVRRAHRAVERGLDVDVPVLVCAAGRSGPHDRLHDDLGRTDSVLSVEDVVARAPGLGRDVTVVQIHDGVHDLALSAAPARLAYLATVERWLVRRGLTAGG